MPKPPNYFCVFWVFNSLKPPKTPPKIDAKTFQNPPQDAPKSRFRGGPLKIRFWARIFPLLGGVLERPGGVLGPSWGRPGTVLEALSRLGSVLGASWSRLETSRGRLGAHFIATSTWKWSLINFDYENKPSKPIKINKIHWFYSIRELFAFFMLKAI